MVFLGCLWGLILYCYLLYRGILVLVLFLVWWLLRFVFLFGFRYLWICLMLGCLIVGMGVFHLLCMVLVRVLWIFGSSCVGILVLFLLGLLFLSLWCLFVLVLVLCCGIWCLFVCIILLFLHKFFLIVLLVSSLFFVFVCWLCYV
jgi:hypothetical protein